MKATFRIWRGDKNGGGFKDMATEVSEGMVVLDAVHQVQAEQRIVHFRRGFAKHSPAASGSTESRQRFQNE